MYVCVDMYKSTYSKWIVLIHCLTIWLFIDSTACYNKTPNRARRHSASSPLSFNFPSLYFVLGCVVWPFLLSIYCLCLHSHLFTILPLATTCHLPLCVINQVRLFFTSSIRSLVVCRWASVLPAPTARLFHIRFTFSHWYHKSSHFCHTARGFQPL